MSLKVGVAKKSLVFVAAAGGSLLIVFADDDAFEDGVDTVEDILVLLLGLWL